MKLFCACFFFFGGGGGIAQLSRDMLQNGVYRTDMSGVNKIPRGAIARFAPSWGADNLPEKVSRDTGYRNDSIALSRDMGPLSF